MTGQLIKRVDCDRCLCVAPLRRDGTVGTHSYTRNGRRQKCEGIGKPYAFHMGNFTVIERGPDRVATLWHCACRCGEMKAGPTYESVQAWHAEHYRDVVAERTADAADRGE